MARITRLARSTINRGENDLDAEPLAKGKIRPALVAGAGPLPKLIQSLCPSSSASSSLPSSAIP